MTAAVTPIRAKRPPRWEPDAQLVAAALAGGRSARPLRDLGPPDRSWVVAGLTAAGLTADEIADILDCSLRSIRTVRAEDMTQVCIASHKEAKALTDVLRIEQCDHGATRQELADMTVAYRRIKAQLDRLLDAQIIGGDLIDSCSRGHEMDRYNTYWYRGKRYCRACRRERKASYRAAEKRTTAVVVMLKPARKRAVICAVTTGDPNNLAAAAR